MALFSYTGVDKDGSERKGTIDAVNIDVAISALQRRELIISNIEPVATRNMFEQRIALFSGISTADIVMLSRQMTTLFEAQVSALRAFRLLASEARTPQLGEKLTEIANDVQAGSAISTALSKHPSVFSAFYVNMVRAGEETGKLDETFAFLADYLDRNYELTQKARNALIYPAFILLTFTVVMVLMMTIVIPKLAVMLGDSGQAIPIFTQIVIGASIFMQQYILLILIVAGVAGFLLYRYSTTERGAEVLSRARLQLPAIGNIYQKVFLSRISDNLATMLTSGIQVLRGLEITSTVVGDIVYERVLNEVAQDVKGGLPLSEAMRKHPEMPGIMIAMIKIGEESGNMGPILQTMAKFYRREVNNAVDTLVSLIEPLMIVTLALGVGVLLTAVIMPIYNMASGF